MKKEYSPAEIFNKMKEIVEIPDSPYLKSYKDDFYKTDRGIIEEELCQGSKYIWVLGPSGTYLTRVGVHPKLNEYASITIKNGLIATNVGVSIFLVTINGVTEITPVHAEKELEELNLSVTNGVVRRKNGDLFATFNLHRFSKTGDGNQYASFSFQIPELEHLTKSQILALRDIARKEAETEWGSFFVQVTEITMNNKCIQSLLNVGG